MMFMDLKKLAVAVGALLCVLYIGNVTAGIIEIIPDNIPLFGNIDEAGATLLLANFLAMLGINPIVLKK